MPIPPSTSPRPVIVLVGGSGFIGQALSRQLTAAGYAVRVLTRRESLAAAEAVLPDVHAWQLPRQPDAAALTAALQGAVAVVNLVGILHESGRTTFQRVHVDGVATLIAACRAAGITRLVQVSALGASSDAPSAYLRSKAAAEALVRASGLDWTILQPSVVFGPQDRFLNLFAELAQVMPVLVLACPGARFQPVYVEDVAQAVVRALQVGEAVGATVQLGGREVFTLRELIALVGQWTGVRRPVIGLGPSLSLLQGALMELLPVPLMTRDNVRSMEVPNVCTEPLPDWLALQPASLRLVVPAYLRPEQGRARYGRLRTHAGR